MKNNHKEMQLLEKATSDKDTPLGECDPETASLREAWLAFGEMLEAAEPPFLAVQPTAPVRLLHRRRRIAAAALLAASLLVGAVAVWMLHVANQPSNQGASLQIVQTNRNVVPSVQAQVKAAATADEPQSDDAFDEQIALVGQNIIYVRQNEPLRTDNFALAQHRIEELQLAFQTDSL